MAVTRLSSLDETLSLPPPSATDSSLAAAGLAQWVNQLLRNRFCERVDFGADVLAQQLESGDGCQRDERCGYCVLRKFKTGFITEKSLNHFVAPFRFD
jgi:hypothetical protein